MSLDLFGGGSGRLVGGVLQEDGFFFASTTPGAVVDRVVYGIGEIARLKQSGFRNGRSRGNSSNRSPYRRPT